MAVDSTNIPTINTLKKGQRLFVNDNLETARCYNDSGLTENHYRTIPKDDSDVGQIKWAGNDSVKQSDGTYAVAVSMFEYIYVSDDWLTIGYPNRDRIFSILSAQANGNQFSEWDGKKYQIISDSLVKDRGYIRFRKLVWVNSEDLFFGTAAQQTGIVTDAEKKRQEELDKLAKTNPVTGNTNTPTTKVSTTTWVIISIVSIFIIGIWVLLRGLVKRRKKQEETQKNTGSQVNVIRIPKNA